MSTLETPQGRRRAKHPIYSELAEEVGFDPMLARSRAATERALFGSPGVPKIDNRQVTLEKGEFVLSAESVHAMVVSGMQPPFKPRNGDVWRHPTGEVFVWSGVANDWVAAGLKPVTRTRSRFFRSWLR